MYTRTASIKRTTRTNNEERGWKKQTANEENLKKRVSMRQKEVVTHYMQLYYYIVNILYINNIYYIYIMCHL